MTSNPAYTSLPFMSVSARSDDPALPHDSARMLDAHLHASLAKAWSGISPVSLALAGMDWGLHWLTSPGTQARLVGKAWQDSQRWLSSTWQAGGRLPQAQGEAQLQLPATDPRFDHPAWQSWPWPSLIGAGKVWEAWWQEASDLRGMRKHSREQMRFYGRQVLDVLSPSNWLPTNPQAQQLAWESGGMSLFKGLSQAVHEIGQRHGLPSLHDDAPGLAPGQGLAMTPGRVVLRNHLIELIQYAPSTARVHQTPVLIVPSCIMKYYILDLSPHNSMARWLVGQGHTVYIVSWRNPDAQDALLGMDDYVRDGVLAAWEHVHETTGQPVHLVGYCLGGTFAAAAAAALDGGKTETGAAGAPEERPLASLTLMAAETDFTEPGELGVLIDEAQILLLEDMMAEKGFLTGRQMAGSFQFLHSRELVWSSRTRRWLLGQEEVPNDLMSWNADVTRLPAVMHSQYLRRCYLHNELANGHFTLDEQPLSLRDIHTPLFAVGTVKDHVSPWRSVFKVHRLVSAPVTFALTSGGHNAGIVSEPGHPGRHYQLLTMTPEQPRCRSDEWQARAPRRDGSWWEAWSDWLIQQGAGRQVPARHPPDDAALGAAPGRYVMVRYGD